MSDLRGKTTQVHSPPLPQQIIPQKVLHCIHEESEDLRYLTCRDGVLALNLLGLLILTVRHC